MPIYEYACPKCGEFEISQRITEDALKRCPKCRSKVKKLISQTSFQLKGSGWYVTDYARKGGGEKGKSSESKSSESTSSSTSDTSSSSSESKSETKTESKKETKKDGK